MTLTILGSNDARNTVFSLLMSERGGERERERGGGREERERERREGEGEKGGGGREGKEKN